MADTLVIQELAVACRLGVREWEQARPQTVWIDLALGIDAAWAASRDAVEASIDYGRLVTVVRQLAQRQPYRLMETLAEAIATCVLKEFRPSTVQVRVKKKALPGIGYAAVEVERTAVRPRRRSRPGGRAVRGAVGAGVSR